MITGFKQCVHTRPEMFITVQYSSTSLSIWGNSFCSSKHKRTLNISYIITHTHRYTCMHARTHTHTHTHTHTRTHAHTHTFTHACTYTHTHTHTHAHMHTQARTHTHIHSFLAVKILQPTAVYHSMFQPWVPVDLAVLMMDKSSCPWA